MFKTYFIPIIALFIGFFGLGSGADSDSENLLHPDGNNIDSMITRFGQSAYKSFYSIEELRPISIIHLDKTSEMYANKWISPDEIIPLLNNEEKKSLKSRIGDIIETMEPERRKNMTLQINNWCMADIQFSVLLNTMGFAPSELLKAVYENDRTRYIFHEFGKQGNTEINLMEPNDKDKALNKAKNAISYMTKKEQMDYYSDIFSKLALIVKN